MRTLKTSFAKLIGLALLNCFTLTALGQTNQNLINEDFGYRDDHKTRVYFSPLNLANPGGNSFQLTAGKSFWEAGELQVNIAQRLGSGDPFLMENIAGLFLFNVNAEYIRGTRIGFEVQQTVHRTKVIDLYAGLEAAYSQDEIYLRDATVLIVLDQKIDETITRRSKIFNAKIGLKFYIAENFIIDTYAGAGYNSFSIVGSTQNKLNLPINVKLGYQF